uniref:Major facilitator superfamily (MFS) profile domain-containing protein n=2 Tax=Erythrolobus australicus TaxID=1077150 RepID=A0A7S1TKM9_9RHOD|mmetsp:Transcript_2363/g.6403  ORF Transcript_2363/g.6403 Transcript_2363/m.6403 type:complete len:496 (+) Transcript_2363:60-1547(+)
MSAEQADVQEQVSLQNNTVDDPTFGPQPIDPETGERLFRLPVDEKHRAFKMQPWRFDRPHMRAFFFAWSHFFIAFFGWFAVAPLMTTIKEDEKLGLGTKKARGNSNVIAVSGTILMRLIIGPFSDRYGPRVASAGLMTIFSLPVYLIGTAQNYASFCTARFFIGFLGATFVVTQYWTSIMFAPLIVGTANATSAGWGNLGGGVTNALMPQFFNMFVAFGLTEQQAWRVAMVIPGTMALAVGVLLYFFSDDSPDGNFRDLHMSGAKQKTNPWLAMKRASVNGRSWILHLLYATCFGVELIMNNNLASYFTEEFGLSQGTAGLVASLFGLMNLFARSLGGIASDYFSKRFGMTGRLWVFFIVEFVEGLFLLLFSRLRVLGAAIAALIAFSTCVQMAEGATFGVVPFVDPVATGAVSGIVGAGGNVGAMTLGLLFANFDGPEAMLYLSFVVIGVSFLVFPLMWGPLKVIDTESGRAVAAGKEIDDELVESRSSVSVAA